MLSSIPRSLAQTIRPVCLTLSITAVSLCSSFTQAQSNAEISNANAIFDWAERSFPDFFGPTGVSTFRLNGFAVRYYSATESWLGVNNGQVFVFGDSFDSLSPVGEGLKLIGSADTFLEIAADEQDVPGLEGGDINAILALADANAETQQQSPVRRINRGGRRGEANANGGPQPNNGNPGPREADRATNLGNGLEGERRGEGNRNQQDGRRPPQGDGDNFENGEELNVVEFRFIDGSGNNETDTDMGATSIPLVRVVPSAYADGISALAGAERPSPRLISNVVSSQTGSIINSENATDMVWQWGQFLDHDIDLTDGVEPQEPASVSVPSGDMFFDPTGTGTAIISLNRSLYDVTVDENSPRQQLNEITSWIDASNVYGSDLERANALRTLDGTGRMKTSAGDFLPFNTDGFANAGGDSETLFFAGDVRANEQLGLTAIHTLFVREHNRLVAEIAQEEPTLDGEELYQQARRLVGAQMQVITYREYLPALLGRGALDRYRDYDPSVNASIMNLFSTAAYRYGHSALSPQLLRLDSAGNETADGHIALRDAFFSPHLLAAEGGVEPLLRGLATQISQDIDPFVVDDVRNFLFGPPGSGGFDLVSLNIQRGRDHGLPSYNDTREALGLGRKASFAEISSNAEIQSRLAEAYDTVDQIDVWVGGLAEDDIAGALVGELISTVLVQQFTALRDGDRFWYENSMNRRDINRVENTSLADIIKRNTDIGDEIQNNVFSN